MIETGQRARGRPVRFRRVTAAAGSSKGARVRIPVARGAIVEGQIPIVQEHSSGIGRMAFDTGDFFMRALEAEPCIPVVKSRRLLPVLRIMAALALNRQLSAMHIGVAVGASLRETKIGAGQILHRNRASGFHRNVRRLMASAAALPRVPTLEPVACHRMVKLLNGHTPMDEIEIPAGVLIMALRTISSGCVRAHQRRVPTCFGLNALTDIAMAIKTFELGRPLPGVVAIRTVTGSVQHTVRLRQFARRNLGARIPMSEKPEETGECYGRSRPSPWPNKTRPVHKSPQLGTGGMGCSWQICACSCLSISIKSRNIKKQNLTTYAW
jgi:hypothetical protein